MFLNAETPVMTPSSVELSSVFCFVSFSCHFLSLLYFSFLEFLFSAFLGTQRSLLAAPLLSKAGCDFM